ncbi:SRPBCC family protein [Streptomyces spongiicola]|uniref:SRPBCC domain-containing protein n=1 Tax=Streptomyces spongiicola TaxID=1690221 RepID=A0ABM6VAY0_9ACTN|nr:SRPBCC domain-containing protein [Streptomyces spongiicola]AWK10974.1 SRPBCC domain-containing protein [Streptomyces spongiicola]
MTVADTAALNEITVTRVLDAPRAAVYRAWTEPGQFARWWGPRGFTTDPSTVELDVRVGGTWKATMAAEGIGEFPFTGVYREVVPDERLVFTLVDPNDENVAARAERGEAEELTTVTFADHEGGTKLSFQQVGQVEPEKTAEVEAGWNSFLDCLADHLAGA